jgi:penicillin-binding protein 2
VGIGQGETQVTPLQLARALGGIASDGHFVRPHVVMPDQNIPADFRQAIQESFPGSGDKDFALNPDTWTIITDGMAAAATTGTAAAAHMEGVGGGDTHTKGGAKTPNAWFVGMIPRRNPEIVITVLQEHGDWGSGSAMIAQKIAIAYVNKKRTQDKNVLNQADLSKPVEVGAVWSEPAPVGRKHSGGDSVLHAGHFLIDPGPLAPAKAVASARPTLPAWLLAMPLRFKEGQP